jgi:hypothetical protein
MNHLIALQHLQNRVDRLKPLVVPPTLRLITLEAEAPPEDLTRWDLVLKIEPKRPAV